jgi:hypothetical protein
MARKSKKYALRPDQIRPLAEGHGACFASDLITVEGQKVGYLYREEPDHETDSGWRFLSGAESQAYMEDTTNFAIYDVNTIANYDPDIVPLLDAPVGAAFERQGPSGRFVQIAGGERESDPDSPRPEKRWPPPGFPLVEGHYDLTEAWSIQLSEPFARRIEDGSLVLWRPGVTLWLAAWGNDHGETQATRLARTKKTASKKRRDPQEVVAGNLTRFSYRLLDDSDEGPVESLHAFVFSDEGQLDLVVYLDDPADAARARELVDSVTARS